MCAKTHPSTTNQLKNLHVFQNDFFREAIRSHVSEYYTHFGERLVSVYVWGSVHRNEAIPGVSDLDLHSFITDASKEADLNWLKEASERLEQQFPETRGLSRPRSVYKVLQVGVRLRYHSTLVWGCDLTDGLDIPFPYKSSVRRAFQSVWDLTRYAAGLEEENRTDFSLPDEPPLRLRKLARLGVLGGAYLLMAQGQTRSYTGTVVIPVLEKTCPKWKAFLTKTRGSYIRLTDPTTNDEVSEYLSQLVEWLDWIKTQLE